VIQLLPPPRKHTSNRFKILKKFRNDCDAAEHALKISIFLMKRVNISF
jgi:hypothetical protein